MTRFRSSYLFGFLLFLSIDSAAQSAEDFILRIHLNEGDTFTYEFIAEQFIKQTLAGETHELDQTFLMSGLYNIIYAQDGIYEIQVTYDRILIEQDGPFGLIAYDSDEPTGDIPPMLVGFSALAGQQFTMKMNDTGKVLEVRGVDLMRELMIAKMDSMGLTYPDMEESMKLQFNDESMRADMERMLLVFPERELSIGDSWTDVVEDKKAFVPMRMTNTYHVAAEEEGLLQIDVESTIDPSADLNPSDTTMAFQMFGVQQGTLWIDRTTGLPTRLKTTQTVAGEVTMSGMKWPIEIESVNSLKME